MIVSRSARVAHPRACGENRVTVVAPESPEGSSPRVWGKRQRTAITGRPLRFIPARAGKTMRRARTPPSCRAHPRACGENIRPGWPSQPGHGSSPRVRGKPPVVRESRDLGGLIPARAGKTAATSTSTIEGAAHPRACGENVFWATSALLCLGSSPRVRGKLRGFAALVARAGLIPARAGKTLLQRLARARDSAHPRACGENYKNLTLVELEEGSSPRVRGKQKDTCSDPVPTGSSPRVRGKPGGC